MGLFDSLKHAFGHHGHGKRVGEPLTLADAKALLASIVVRQQLADMRKVADAVKQLQDELPQYATFGMSHYYSEPKRVRFQSEGGRFIDADAIATAYAASAIVRDECEIQHLMGDIADNREHRDPATTPAVPIDDLLRATAERTRPGAYDRSRRDWLFALFDQLGDIDEATKHNLAPLADQLSDTLPESGQAQAAADPRGRITAMIADALYPDDQNGHAAVRELMMDPSATATDYLDAVTLLHGHGLAVPGMAD